MPETKRLIFKGILFPFLFVCLSFYSSALFVQSYRHFVSIFLIFGVFQFVFMFLSSYLFASAYIVVFCSTYTIISPTWLGIPNLTHHACGPKSFFQFAFDIDNFVDIVIYLTGILNSNEIRTADLRNWM